ncbi:MAG TPA: lysylphosphatidylglycerol synthase transmembrane domain-containing protein, partial [Polyangiaceae bacterium]|nr:lysylphosphatidylglycerol synthase transmembrane domain-containing protein [Polyangiaceae bacterium]
DQRPASARDRWRTVVLALLQAACVAYVAHALWLERATLRRALDLSATTLLLLIVLMILAHLQRSLEFTYMLRRLGVHERFWSGFLLTGAGYLLNHLPLNAGFMLRAALLKRDHALPYSSYLGLTLVNALINVAAGAAIGLVAAGIRALQGDLAVVPLVGFGGVVLAAGLAIWLPSSWVPPGDGFVKKRLRTLLDGTSLIRGNGVGILLLAGLALTRIVGNALRLWLCFDALGTHISALGAALLGWGSVLFTLINLTPGNLGLREVVLSFAAAELGSTQTLGMAAASMDRVVLLAYVIAVGVPGLYSLERRGSLLERPRA